MLFLGHPYQWAANGERIDYRIEKMDRTRYDQIWLGGDVCARLTEKRSTLRYLDSLLDLSGGKIHWTLGNHDLLYGHPEWIRETTGRDDYYTSWEKGLLILVMNTNLFRWPESNTPDSACMKMDAQAALIRQVCDTIQEATHLVVLHHHCLLTNELANGQTDLGQVFNLYQPELQVSCSEDSASFAGYLYPQFRNVQQRGVQVVFVGGDMGMRAKSFSFQTPEGIWFLGAGINNTVPDFFRPEYITNFDPDQVIEFNYREGKLSWEFRSLNEISELPGPER